MTYFLACFTEISTFVPCFDLRKDEIFARFHFTLDREIESKRRTRIAYRNKRHCFGKQFKHRFYVGCAVRKRFKRCGKRRLPRIVSYFVKNMAYIHIVSDIDFGYQNVVVLVCDRFCVTFACKLTDGRRKSHFR